MNIYLAFSLFALIILVYWVISELFAMLFRFTGLPDEKARFQVISLLTGCGFTTHESELLLTTKSRRRLARITMLFGYVFNITIVSAFINVFFSLKVSELAADLVSSLIPLLVILFILAFMRFPVIRAWGDRLIEKLAGRIVHRDIANTILLMDYIGQETIAQVTLREVPGPAGQGPVRVGPEGEPQHPGHAGGDRRQQGPARQRPDRLPPRGQAHRLRGLRHHLPGLPRPGALQRSMM